MRGGSRADQNGERDARASVDSHAGTYTQTGHVEGVVGGWGRELGCEAGSSTLRHCHTNEAPPQEGAKGRERFSLVEKRRQGEWSGPQRRRLVNLIPLFLTDGLIIATLAIITMRYQNHAS